LYEKLEVLLPSRFPNQKFIFLGNPFTPNLPFPLLWKIQERSLHSTTRLINCWSKLNEFTVKKLRPALEASSVVVTDGFGLDALLYATACVDCPTEVSEAFRLHSEFVSARLAAQEIAAPHYFITCADVRTVDEYMRVKLPRLERVHSAVRRNFIAREERMIRDYFRDVKHQKPPNFVIASLAIEEMVEEVTRVIGTHLQALRRAA
jgi:hypothetical protein